MTVTSTTAKSGPYSGNGSTDEFDYTFYIASESELKVTLTDADGVDTVQTITTHYTVSISADGTGTFTMVTPPATGEKVTATLNVELKQETDLINTGQFFAETHEAAYDKLTRISQQTNERVDRSIKLGQSVTLDPEDVTLANLAGQVIIDTDNFSNVLSSADDTLQEALETLDGGFSARVPKLLGEHTGTNVASLYVVVDGISVIYDVLQLELIGVTPRDDQNSLCMQLNDNGSWHTAADYSSMGFGRSQSAEISWNYSSVTDARLMSLSANEAGDGAGERAYGSLYIYPYALPYYRGNFTYIDYNILVCTVDVGGAILATGVWEGVKLFFDSGNITGTIRLWGLPKGS